MPTVLAIRIDTVRSPNNAVLIVTEAQTTRTFAIAAGTPLTIQGQTATPDAVVEWRRDIECPMAAFLLDEGFGVLAADFASGDWT